MNQVTSDPNQARSAPTIAFGYPWFQESPNYQLPITRSRQLNDFFKVKIIY